MPTLNNKTYTDKDGKICMIYCLKCGQENWAPAVSIGTCAWCGFDANEEKKQVSCEQKKSE